MVPSNFCRTDASLILISIREPFSRVAYFAHVLCFTLSEACDRRVFLLTAVWQDYMPDDVLEVLRTLREGEGVFGMDIGGTLAKAAQLLKPGEAHLSPSTFGKTGTFHQELSFQLKVMEVIHDVHFLSGATYYLETGLQ